MNKYLVIIGVLLVALAVSLFFNFRFLSQIRELQTAQDQILQDQAFPDVPSLSGEIDSFEDCVAAGYPVMESYPEQCATPDGKSFTRDISGDAQVQP